jgi:general secretion pathway protein A
MATEYVRHFGLSETPFARNHDPRWLYLSSQHKEAVIKTRWTVEEHGGLALIRADVGHGKSFLVEYLMSAWPGQYGWRCAKLQNTGTITSPRALLAEVLAAFGLESAPTAREMVAKLENWLLEQSYDESQTAVLFIDEAQSVDSKALPVLRDLLNLATRDRILLQIVLSAQLNIDRKLHYFPALQSRIASVSTLEGLSQEETDAMLLHRFKRAGALDPIFLCPAETVKSIYLHSGGVPRDVLVVAEAAMKEAFLRDADRLLPQHVERAVQDMACRRPRHAKAA